MTTEDFRNLLLLAAVEETDGAGEAIPPEERREAARHAGATLPPKPGRRAEDAFLAARARFLLKLLSARHPGAAWLDPDASCNAPQLSLAGPVLLASAALAGYLSNELGPERRINILSFPLLGILAWSALVYLREIWLLLRGGPPMPGSAWLGRLSCGSDSLPPEPGGAAIAAARALFRKRWAKLFAPVLAARLKALLHAAALVLAAFAIAGLYVRGLANEYRAVWESTFIQDSETLRQLLGFVLGPAAALFGSGLPEAAELDAIRGSEAEGEIAARWIHWYALTIALFVVAPRALLSLLWGLRSGRLARSLPYRETSPRYFGRLLATSSGAARPVVLQPYAFDPEESVREALAARLEDTLGAAVAATWAPAAAFGEEEDFPFDLPDEGSEVVPVFSFSATPEAETHLAFARALSTRARGAVHHVLLDASAFDRRSRELGGTSGRREEREAAWRRLFVDEPIQLLFHPETPA